MYYGFHFLGILHTVVYLVGSDSSSTDKRITTTIDGTQHCTHHYT